MQDESAIGWDPTTIYPQPSMALKIYVLFSFVAIVAALVRLGALWIAAPPFTLRRRASDPAYLQQLFAATQSLKQWIGCTLLAGGLVAFIDLAQTCNRLLESKALNGASILGAIRNSIPGFTLTFLVALVLYLARWHLLNRRERLRELTSSVSV